MNPGRTKIFSSSMFFTLLLSISWYFMTQKTHEAVISPYIWREVNCRYEIRIKLRSCLQFPSGAIIGFIIFLLRQKTHDVLFNMSVVS